MKLLKFLIKIILVTILVLASVGIYAFKVEPNLLITKEYQLGDRDTDQTLSIIQFSDLELSEYYTAGQLPAIVDRINSLEPDIVVFTGDLFANYAQYRPTKEVIDSLSKIVAKYGKYAIWGNNDYGGGASRHYKSIMEQSGFQVLKNEGVVITLPQNKNLFLGGLDDSLLGRPNLKLTTQKLNKNTSYNILLAHEPNMVDLVQDYPFDLILSGHTHGRQVNIEYLRDHFGINHQYLSGFYELKNGSKLYVDSGMETSRLPVRFGVPPQITYFQIGI